MNCEVLAAGKSKELLIAYKYNPGDNMKSTMSNVTTENKNAARGKKPVLNGLISVDFENLKHMTGCEARYPKRDWGFRNHFAPGGEDIESMERLESVGLVIRSCKYHETNFFHATKSGCEAIGMKPAQIKNALSK